MKHTNMRRRETQDLQSAKPQANYSAMPPHQMYPYVDMGKNRHISQEPVPLRNANSYEKTRHSYKGALYSILLAVLGTLVLSAVIILFMSKIQIHTIKMTGDITLPQEILESQINIDLPQKYFDISTRGIKDRLVAHPLIYQAKVHKTLSGRLNIMLERADSIVSILAEVNGVHKPVYFDKLGRCVQVGAELGIVDVPIISGLTLVNPAVGVYLPEWVLALIHRLNDIKLQNPSLYKQISEIAIQDMGDEYRILEINFIGLKPKFITNININTNVMMQIWQLGNKVVNSSNPELLDFDYFDLRQGVIIGMRESK